MTGRDKPSAYRTAQNVIRDSSSGSIVYLPPEAPDVPELMQSLVDWINSELSDGELPAPIVAALAHYQFATIHPYLDGNGRTARLWVNCLASRYGLPPFLRLRPRPEGRYALACARAMLADRAPTVALFHELLASFPAWDDRET